MSRCGAGWKTGAAEECGVVDVAWRQEGRGEGGCSGSRSGAWTLGMVGVKV